MDKQSYVPEPKPVATDIDVYGLLFPGLGTQRQVGLHPQIAPNRKPLLGYYDEVESDVRGLADQVGRRERHLVLPRGLVLGQGTPAVLTHWFDAYRKAKYRDMLQVAIMWANHNPPGTHSPEDWRNVAGHWIDRVLHPARLLSASTASPPSSSGTRNGSAATSAAAVEYVSRSMNRSRWLGRRDCRASRSSRDHEEMTPTTCAVLAQEGYCGVTNTTNGARRHVLCRSCVPYATLSRGARRMGAQTEGRSGLDYYPVVDTGWDDHPWHGEKSWASRGGRRNCSSNCSSGQRPSARRTARSRRVGSAQRMGRGQLHRAVHPVRFRHVRSRAHGLRHRRPGRVAAGHACPPTSGFGAVRLGPARRAAGVDV